MKIANSVLCILFVLSGLSFGGQATQTDWSGYEGILGPVTVWSYNYNTDVRIYSNDPNQITLNSDPLIEHLIDSNFDGASSVHAADIDNDGCMDVLGAAEGANQIAWWKNSGVTYISWSKHVISNSFDEAKCVYAIDIDNDGDMDVLGAAGGDNGIVWWENSNGSGTVWTEHIVDDGVNGAAWVDAADVDNDGDLDVVGAISGDSDIIWWENSNGSGTSWIKHTVASSFISARSVYATDIDGDGDVDILGAAFEDDAIAWWENTDGSGSAWTEHLVKSSFNGACSVHAVDVDGDGDVDVLGAAFYDDEIAWWENNNSSGTVWIEHSISGSIGGARSVYGSDMDGDGDIDIIGAGSSANEIAGWENTNGSGTDWVLHCVDESINGASSIFVSDVDGDGGADVIGSGVFGDNISWWEWENDIHFSEGYLESSIYDVQTVPSWQSISWNSDEPSGTSVSFLVRASSDFQNMGPWSDTLAAPGSLVGVLADGARYMQYKAILETVNSSTTPALQDVTVYWEPFTDIGETNAAEVPSLVLYGADTNPAFDQVGIMFSIPFSSRVELTVYDVTGRAVQVLCDEYNSGTHEVLLDNLSSGAYTVHMSSGGFSETGHFVIIR